MKCSLLTLSTYLDGELAPDRAGEVEAHLIACQRCSTGLGYLQEEQSHIRALAAVTADPGAAEDLLGIVGLSFLPVPVVAPPQPAPQFLLDLAESPQPAAVPPVPDASGSYLELNGSPAPIAAASEPEAAGDAPVEAREVAVEEPVDTAVSDERDDAHVFETFDWHADELGDAASGNSRGESAESEPLVAETGRVADTPLVSATPPGPPTWSQPFRRAHPEPEAVAPQALVDTAVDATAHAVEPVAPVAPPLRAPSPGVALQGRPSSWLDRARDAVSVRWALMRGSSTGDFDDDDSIQIVSGAGAPDRRSSRPSRVPRDMSPSAASPSMPYGEPAAAPVPAETPDISFAPPEHEPLRRPAFTTAERLAARAASDKLTTDGVLARADSRTEGVSMPAPDPAHDAPARSFSFDMQEPIAPPTEVPRPLLRDDEPTQPGRHRRALQREGLRFTRPSFSMPRPARDRAARPADRANRTSNDRLLIFGAAVAVLALFGLLVGKSVTTAPRNLPAGGVPNPTAIAQSTAHANSTATPRPTPEPTATPVPTLAVANPNVLTGTQNLGDGDTGFSVQDIRYGAHPGDFRIVFDLNGSGAPTTTVGFGNPTTLYVIFSGTTAGSSFAQPASGNVVTAVKLLQPSPISGKTIYEFTLSAPAKLATLYLQSPVRLVIDLS